MFYNSNKYVNLKKFLRIIQVSSNKLYEMLLMPDTDILIVLTFIEMKRK